MFLQTILIKVYQWVEAQKNCKKNYIHTSGNLESVNYTFSVWIYVDNWQYKYSKPKVIFRRTNEKTGLVSPSLSLAPSTNDLDISMSTSSATSAANVDSWSIQNIPIQKWCSVILAVNNRTVDTYIDGKLVNTHVLSGVPKLDKDSDIQMTPMVDFLEPHLNLDIFLELLILVKHMKFTGKDPVVMH